MRKLYATLSCIFLLSTGLFAQYQVNGWASVSPTDPNDFQLVPADQSHIAGSVFNTTRINLAQSFELTTKLFFGTNDIEGGDGLAFVLQGEGPGYIGNMGAGLGYHRFDGNPAGMPVDNPGPVPSFIVEFDTYQNGDIFTQNIGDPAEDHLGFMTRSNAYHTNPTTLGNPYPFPVNIEDGSWHDAKFIWNAATKIFSVQFLNQTYSVKANLDSIVGGSSVYWGFTASYGHAPNEHRVKFVDLKIGQPLTLSGLVTNASCTPGAIDLIVNGGTAPYTYTWTNGSHNEDLPNVPAGTYTVTVVDATGASDRATFAVLNVPDNVPPQLNCAGNVTLCYNILLPYYNVPAVAATDNCSTPTVTYSITGATSRSGSGKNASGLFNPGVSTITWKAKDAAGNVAVCTTTVNINKVTAEIPDVYTVMPGGKANTIYLGYGPASITLTAKVTGGTAPYTYQWSNGATTPFVTVNPSREGTYTYLVVVRDATGCTTLDVKVVKVDDIRCGNKLDKITVCHIPPGNPRNAGEICISKSAVPDHLAHGDRLGSCNDRDDDHLAKQADVLTLTQMSKSSGVYPNPTRGRFELSTSPEINGAAQVVIMNANGVVVDKKNVQVNTRGQVLKLDLTGKAAGIYLVKIITKEGSQTEKIIVQQ